MGSKVKKIKCSILILVILDVMMPGISGYKTCEEIRKKVILPSFVFDCKR